MRLIKMLPLLAMITLLASGCAKPVQEEVEEAYDTVEEISADARGYGTGSEGASITEKEVRDSAYADKQAKVELKRIYFAFDQFDLDTEARQALQNNALYLEQNPSASIILEGHCDERGSDEYNLALGERRARAAAEYMVNLGINKNRIRTISYGEEKPLDRASTEAAWALNRRAEFKKQR
ncbi:MAG: peptidoglycan-associated lipoprotein Pal [Desulfuromonadaceae bacterium]|nr:peptidoglycan-associated lipoprotein Pal [Desulfuromonas sp.]MDY0184935.1 peptidoglycan-associated lipoprotein Pal [Desulfuromonadaceae bacterium]